MRGTERSSGVVRAARRGLLVVSSAFAALTIYDVTVNGYLEPVTLFPDHFEAGAGSSSFLVRLALLVAILGLTPVAMWRRSHVFVSFIRAGVLSLVAACFFGWSAIGIQREAERYDEAVFDEAVSTIMSGGELTRGDVLARLGPPLVTGPCDDARECWSYTYMPSGGFGWRKRLVVFDRAANAVEWLRNNEP